MWTLVAVPPGADVPSGFLPKRGLKLNLHKCMYSTITISGPQKQQPIVEVCLYACDKLVTGFSICNLVCIELQAQCAVSVQVFSRLMHSQPSGSLGSAVAAESATDCEMSSTGVQHETWCLAKTVLKGMATN